MSQKAPGYVAVAPIFLEHGRSYVGDVLSNALMPVAKITLDIAEMVLNIEQDYDNGNEESFVVTLNESETEQDYSVCSPYAPIEDPWGGCAVSNGSLTKVEIYPIGNKKWAYASGSLDTTWGGSKYVLFAGGTCLNNTAKTNCLDITDVNPTDRYFNMGTTAELLIADPCGSDTYYVYDNSLCE